MKKGLFFNTPLNRVKKTTDFDIFLQSCTKILKTCYLCSLEKVDKKLFLIGSLLDKKFKEVLAQLQNDTSSKEESTTTKVTARKIDPTLVEVKKLAKLAKNESSTEEPNIKLNPKLGPKRVEVNTGRI